MSASSVVDLTTLSSDDDDDDVVLQPSTAASASTGKQRRDDDVVLQPSTAASASTGKQRRKRAASAPKEKRLKRYRGAATVSIEQRIARAISQRLHLVHQEEATRTLL